MTSPNNDPIKHVILLMLENHSFDQMLGCLKSPTIYPDLEGIDPDHPRYNDDGQGNRIFQSKMLETQMIHDPAHENADVMEQLSGENSGFAANFVKNYPRSSLQERQAIMGYYPLDFLPALHTLARNFTVCDHWFSSLPGPTWPNRFFALSGTCMGHVEMPSKTTHALGNLLAYQSQETIFNRLNEAGKSWNIFYYDFPCSLILTQMRAQEMTSRFRKIDDFFAMTAGPESEFPEFAFIEPKYYGLDQNDDHPPHNVMKAQKLIADVYNAIRSNEDLWNTSLFVILYDEHGGFYDHVVPPAAVPPDDHTEQFAFDRLGVRVPAVLVSPWVRKGVEKTVFDHTSLLKYLSEKWNLRPLTRRSEAAASIGGVIQSHLRSNTPLFIRIPYSKLIPSHPERELSDLSIHHSALQQFLEATVDSAEKLWGESAEVAALRAAVEFESVWTRLRGWFGSLLYRLGYRWSSAIVKRRAQSLESTTALLLRKRESTSSEA